MTNLSANNSRHFSRGNVITEVWRHNLEEELYKIMDLVEENKYISLDTEFPGVVCNPNNEYAKIKENVEKLKIIQIGFTIGKEDSLYTNDFHTWQFNFKFDQNYDSHSPDSIRFLTKAGINFEKLERDGIETKDFAELVISTGLILNEDLVWISFHGGFDFGYLLRLLLNGESMPNTLKQFYSKLKLYFPQFVDLKYIIRNVDELKFGGLSRLAAELDVNRIGEEHQAGSDCLLTLAVYLKLKEKYPKLLQEEQNLNIIFALENEDDESKDYYGVDYFHKTDYIINYYNNYGLNGVNNMMNNFYQFQGYGMYGNNYNEMFTDDFNGLNPTILQKQKSYK